MNNEQFDNPWHSLPFFNSDLVLDLPTPPNEMDGAAAAARVQGAQLSTIPYFDGKESIEVEIWLRALDRAMRQFAWTDANACDVAKSRLSGKAAVWLHALEERGVNYEAWAANNDPERNLRVAIKLRFYPTITPLEATSATMNLRQLNSESASQFYDRCILAVEKKNHRVTAADKATDYYKRQFDVDLFGFLLRWSI